jgi:hypothetical protein
MEVLTMKTKRAKSILIDINGNATDFYRSCEIVTGPISANAGQRALPNHHTDSSAITVASEFGWATAEVINGHVNGKSHMCFAFRSGFGISLEFLIDRVVKLHKAQLTEEEIIESALTELNRNEKRADSVTDSLFGISFGDLIRFIVGSASSNLLNQKKVLYGKSGWVFVTDLPNHVADCIYKRFALTRMSDAFPEMKED